MKPAKVQLIHPPIRIIGRTLVRVPFNISKAMLGSGGGEREGTRESVGLTKISAYHEERSVHNSNVK